jgi:hypothetical protein
MRVRSLQSGVVQTGGLMLTCGNDPAIPRVVPFALGYMLAFAMSDLTAS